MYVTASALQMLGNMRQSFFLSLWWIQEKLIYKILTFFFIFCLPDQIEQLTERVIHGLWAPYLHVGVRK